MALPNARFGFICVLAASLYISLANGSGFTTPVYDWLGSGPIDSYGTPYYPHYPYHPDYSPVYDTFTPVYYGTPVFFDPFWRHPSYYNYWPHRKISDTGHTSKFKYEYAFYPYWVGSHKDLSKLLDIAKYKSSVKVYSGGTWQSL